MIIGEFFKLVNNDNRDHSDDYDDNDKKYGLIVTIGNFLKLSPLSINNNNNNNNKFNNNKIKELQDKSLIIYNLITLPKCQDRSNQELIELLSPDKQLISKSRFIEKKGNSFIQILYIDLSRLEHDILKSHYSSLEDINDNKFKLNIINNLNLNNWSNFNITFTSIGNHQQEDEIYNIDYNLFIKFLFSNNYLNFKQFLNLLLKLDNDFLEILKYKDFENKIENECGCVSKKLQLNNIKFGGDNNLIDIPIITNPFSKKVSFNNKSNNDIFIYISRNKENNNNIQILKVNSNTSTSIKLITDDNHHQSSPPYLIINLGYILKDNQIHLNVLLYNIEIKNVGTLITIKQQDIDNKNQILFTCLKEDFEKNLIIKYSFSDTTNEEYIPETTLLYNRELGSIEDIDFKIQNSIIPNLISNSNLINSTSISEQQITTTTTTTTTTTNNSKIESIPIDDGYDYDENEWYQIENPPLQLINKQQQEEGESKKCSKLLTFLEFQELIYNDDDLFKNLKFETIELRKDLQSLFIYVHYFRNNPYQQSYWIQNEKKVTALFNSLHNNIKKLIVCIKNVEKESKLMDVNSARPFAAAAASFFNIKSVFIEPVLIVSDKLVTTISNQINKSEFKEREILLDKLYNIISFANHVFLEIYFNISTTTISPKLQEVLNLILNEK